MKRIIIAVLLILNLSIGISQAQFYSIQNPYQSKQSNIIDLGIPLCKNISGFQESDIPTIFVPGITASWYAKEGFKDTEIKRWIPDPITHSYDTLFYTFIQQEYTLKDVFYTSASKVEIKGTPKQGLYTFGYDWKKDNVFTGNNELFTLL